MVDKYPDTQGPWEICLMKKSNRCFSFSSSSSSSSSKQNRLCKQRVPKCCELTEPYAGTKHIDHESGIWEK